MKTVATGMHPINMVLSFVQQYCEKETKTWSLEVTKKGKDTNSGRMERGQGTVFH